MSSSIPFSLPPPISLSSSSSFPSVSIHRLPCTIQHNGPANISRFFIPQQVQQQQQHQDNTTNNIYEVNFRGRKLLGLKENLPEGMIGLVVKKEFTGYTENNNFNDDNNQDNYYYVEPQETFQIRCQAQFSSITHWLHDEIPKKDTALVSKWLDLARLARVVQNDEEI
jgi:ribonuclease H2 subunit C